ncbi:plasmid replication initiator TrfA [Methylomonas sp. OY6]|uniref:Plasmid replication initiator TrfA n=1 Tax=Methylomonas defluvii TaxID=3045149 RepID=A0ABU4U8X0_9GAMM|nr:plasmid replication initiator TrfA [Methylomonas sp. OY6]MDX8125873.1 plasmid replication initiator TrfA [Methylomonas sp. OY6]
MTQNTVTSLTNLTERFQSLTERKKAQPRHVEPLATLPSWPAGMRGTPNACLRSALFAGVQGNERIAYKKRTLLAAVEGIEVRYLGVQLNQSDLDVWMQIVHLSRMQLPGFSVTFSAHALLVALARSTGKSQHEWLKESMARLGGAFVEITYHGRQTFGEKGFLRYHRDELTQRYVVELTESMLRLFEEGYTHIEFEQRQQLRKHPLALWLHGFLSSHAAPYPLKLQTLYQLSGSSTQNPRDFKLRMRKALQALVMIGALENFEIDEDVVKVKKQPTPTQKRHLELNQH